MEMKPVDVRTALNDPRQPWSKPDVRRLTINLDTLADPRQPLKLGSATDGFEGTGFPAG